MMPAFIPETKQLGHLLAGVACRITGDIENITVTGLAADSRKVQPGNLFAALKGSAFDGHDYVGQAAASGSAAILVDKAWAESARKTGIPAAIPVLAVDDTRIALGSIAANFFDHPDRQLTMIGITGTNGKTTTSFLVEAMLKACGKRPGVIGTVNYRYSDKNDNSVTMEAPFTTPESPTLFALLRRMADENITDVVMEVSSHALAQSRLTGLAFDIAVFTNLSRDHLDFHADMQHYFSSKKMLFTHYLKPGGQAVIVLDDNCNWSTQMLVELKSPYLAGTNAPSLITCGVRQECDVHPLDCTIDIHGIRSAVVTPSGKLAVKTPLAGQFNLRNMLCAIGIGIAHGENLACMQEGLASVRTVPGRLERVFPPDGGDKCPTVFVDYAHTPDALENVLSTLKELRPQRLVCIFGCGGDRDPGKRPIMGEIAGTFCGVVIATSDNPRSESPEAILAQVEKGIIASGLARVPARQILRRKDAKGYDIVASRHRAIHTAIRFAWPGDVILISGKGHENYQISRSGRIFFDDRVEADMHLHAAAGSPHAWKLTWVQQITGGQLLSPGGVAPLFDAVSTDSRTTKPGDLFVAIRGENFDGRSFAAKAVEKGAAGLLVNLEPGSKDAALGFQPQVPVLLVPDTVYALGELASHRRSWKSDLRVVALTGSSGKTTVKEMTAAILRQKHRILKTEGNFNNLIGLPLTLLNLEPQHEIAVLEMGMNRPGEIARLTEIADPDIACIINVQEAHLEGLGDIQGVARAKNELFAGLRADGKAAVNLDDEIVRSLADQLQQEKITFGCSPEAFVRATHIRSLGTEGMAYTLHIGKQNTPVEIRALGKHNVTNSLAAAAMAYGLNAGIAEIAAGLADFRPYDKRAQVETLAAGILVLNDCYNANPASMLAALNTLKDLKSGHRAVAVLGDMLELGGKSGAAHAALGRAVHEKGIDFLAAFGSQAGTVVDSARQAGMDPAAAKSFSSKEDLASWVHALMHDSTLATGDWLLIKGSRGMRMEEVLALLRGKQNNNKTAGN